MAKTEPRGEEPARYAALAAAVGAAGFYTGGVEAKEGCWDRTTICSTSENGVLSGNSFWVAEVSANWYAGTWGGMIYHIPAPDRVAEFCIAWLRAEARLTADFSTEMKTAFGLKPVSDDEFDRRTGSIRPEVEARAIAEVAARAGVPIDRLQAQADWDGSSWQALVWRRPATGPADYLLLISMDLERVEFGAC